MNAMHQIHGAYFRTEVDVLQHNRAVPELLDAWRYALFIWCMMLAKSNAGAIMVDKLA